MTRPPLHHHLHHLRGIVFSSGKSKGIAESFARLLSEHFPTQAWTRFFDRNNEGILVTFLKKLLLIDMAVLILSDDELMKVSENGNEIWAPRDNVVFELGAVMARLGARKVFIVMPEQCQFRRFDYINNLSPKRYAIAAEGDWAAMIGPVCDEIVDQLTQLDDDVFHSDLPATGLAQGYFKNFVRPVMQHLEQQQVHAAGTRSLWKPADGIRLTIIVPDQAMDRQRADTFLQQTFAGRNQHLKVRGGRDVSAYVRPREKPHAPLRVVDIPTTLVTSAEIIERVDSFWGAGDKDFREQLFPREVAAFRRRIENLASADLADDFKAARVRVVTVDEAVAEG